LKSREEYPEEVKWIKISKPNKRKLPNEILTLAEIKKIAEKADHPRDKAFVLVLYESGCRIGELLSLRMKDIQPNKYGIVLNISGKTGSRRVLIISSAPTLANWLNLHPFKSSPEALVWIGVGNKNRYQGLRYAAALMLLKKLARLTGIKKKVNPHAFRHARATHLATKLTEAQMKQYFGWVQSSDMASIYVHLSGRDVDDALLSLHGLTKEREGREEEFKVKICRCGEKNDPLQKFCGRCGAPLSLEVALEVEEKIRKKEELLAKIINHPKILKMILNRIKKLGVEKEFFEV
jgi:integrase